MREDRKDYPAYEKVGHMLVLLIWQHGGDASAIDCRETYGPLADLFELTTEQRNRVITSGKELLWPNHVQYGRRAMCNLGYIHFTRNAVHKIWTLTAIGIEHGAKLAQAHPEVVQRYRAHRFAPVGKRRA